eukprot:4990465-Amphidinium_carterae.2
MEPASKSFCSKRGLSFSAADVLDFSSLRTVHRAELPIPALLTRGDNTMPLPVQALGELLQRKQRLEFRATSFCRRRN